MSELKVKGKITGKEVSEGDGWFRVAFTINEHRYSSFDQDIIDNFNTGDYIEATYTKSKDGKYNNLQSVNKAEGTATDTASENKEVDWDAKDLRSAKMNALNNATALIDILAKSDPEGTKAKLKEINPIDLTKDIATQLVKFIYE
jgi:hypothetical protein